MKREREADIHIPKTRSGGVFTDAKDVNLHANDFSWSEAVSCLSAERAALVQEYQQMCSAALTAAQNSDEKISTGESVTTADLPSDGLAWESHFTSSQHHFPLKNYIVHAFPVLKSLLSSEIGEAAVLECGCGTGSTLLPLMRECQNEKALFVGFDVSASAVSHFLSHPIAQEMTTKKRLVAFSHDITDGVERDEGAGECCEKTPLDQDEQNQHLSVDQKIRLQNPRLAGAKFDAVLLVFVLCALPSIEAMVGALKTLAALLKPQGVLLFRDYALPDHNFFRFLEKRGNTLETLFFKKGDGTSQFFFEKKFVCDLFAEAGFVEDASHGLTYHCNRIENRKNGKRMDKIFINGSFRLK